MLTRLVRPLAGLLAVLGAVAVVAAASRHLLLDLLLDGVGPGYDLPRLVVAAAAGGAVVVCLAALRHVVRSTALRPLLLAGPLLLAVVALEATTGGQPVVAYDGSYVPLRGVTMTSAYSSDLTIDVYGGFARDALLLVAALAVGAVLAVVAVRRRPAPPG